MTSIKQQLIIGQLDKKLKKFEPLIIESIPELGWIYAIRQSLKMSLRQFGERLGISKNSAKSIEKRELEKSITLKSLEEAGKALNMKLVYGFISIDGSIEKTIKDQATKLALEIVKTTSNTMALEGQENTNERLKKAIEDKTKQLINEMPRYLWD